MVRQTAFALLLTSREPVTPAAIAAATGVDTSTLDPILADMTDGGWLDRDASGHVTGAAGLSISDGPHRLAIFGREFRNWCAYDSIGIAAALETDATVRTSCPVCDAAITVPIEAGQPPAGRPERLWLADGGASLRTDFRQPTVLLCSVAHAEEWAARQDGRCRILDLAEAALTGRETWAGCADAVNGLSLLDQ